MDYKEARKLRRKLEITQEKLAADVGMPRSYVSLYELHNVQFNPSKIQEMHNILLTEEKAQYSCRDSE